MCVTVQSIISGNNLEDCSNGVEFSKADCIIIDGDTLTSSCFINNKGVVADSFSIAKQAGYKSGYHGCMGRQ